MHSYGTIVINGLENCKLDSEKEIKINAYMDIVQSATLNPMDKGKMILEIDFMYAENRIKNGFEFRDIIYDIARRMVYQFLDKQIDISSINFEEPSISHLDRGKVIGEGFITFQSINDESEKTDINNMEISIENYDVKKLSMGNQLEERSQILKYTNLYERLKKICNGGQIKVTEKIRERFSDEYNIKCDNENINAEYAEKHPDAKYQDDFTYLRTMIAHGGDVDYSDEIYSRLGRETIKIVKIINILEKEQDN